MYWGVAANHLTAMQPSEFTELLRRHAGLVHKIAFAYCRDPVDRQDVLQEIAVQLWRSRHRFDRRFQETTWIWRIAINVAISFYRREHRHRARAGPLEDADGERALVVEPTPVGGDVQLLLRCIDELGELEKSLALLYLDGLDHASIAEVLGLSVSNVGTKLLRLKDKLRVAFEMNSRAEGKDPAS